MEINKGWFTKGHKTNIGRPSWNKGLEGPGASKMWKGDKVGYYALHNWIHRHKPKPNTCEVCKQDKKLEAANISGKYKRDINDFRWICHKCHMDLDGITLKLKNIWGISLGSKNGYSKLIEENIPVIRNMLNNNLSNQQIANEFNVSRFAIYSIRENKTWGWLK